MPDQNCQQNVNSYPGVENLPFGYRLQSLSHWLVNKARVEPKTVQTILRHSNDAGYLHPKATAMKHGLHKARS
jgi:hypothetical protein